MEDLNYVNANVFSIKLHGMHRILKLQHDNCLIENR